MSKYDEFDAALTSAIQNGADTMAQLETSSRLRGLAARLCTKDRYGNVAPTFSIIDRRLQALRKKGSIVFHNLRWGMNVGRGK